MSEAQVKTLGERKAFPPLLSVDGVKVHYGAINALKGVSLTIGKGELVALIGANGAGKTSTLRAVSGMLKPSAGRITFNGEDITGMKAHLLVPTELIVRSSTGPARTAPVAGQGPHHD